MRILCLAVLFVAGCSADVDVARTVTVSADQLAAIKAKPLARRIRSGGGPAARLAGLEGDSWPEGILFLDYGVYLHDIGFGDRMSLYAIDGVSVHRIFEDRWANMAIRRPGGFHADHYRDLIQYLFDVEAGERRVITVHLDVPYSAREIGSYTPVIEHWALEFTDE